MSSVLEHVGWSVVFWRVPIRFAVDVIVCMCNGSEISFLCIVLYLSVVMLCSVPDRASSEYVFEFAIKEALF